jgi:acetolactate synthase-1/2/3 large subunit
MRDRSFPVARFVTGDAAVALTELVELLGRDMKVDPKFRADVITARTQANDELRRTLGPYEELVHALGAWMPPNALWVRDVTVSNSSWGNRYLPLRGPRDGVHAMGGGIGQGLPMAIGAALAAGDRKTVLLAGDGGLQLSFGEFVTLVQENADVLTIVMNDRGYGVIRNIQDVAFGGRKVLADLHTPDFQTFAKSIGLASAKAGDMPSFHAALDSIGNRKGPALLEVDMLAFGTYASAFAGPPVREAAPA